MDRDPTRLSARYLIVVPIPYHEDAEGRLWFDKLWHHDLLAHFDYLDHVLLAAPCLPKGTETDLVPLVPPEGCRIEMHPLPFANSTLKAFLQLPRVAWAMARAVRDSDIVHSGAAGWPYPPGLLANPLAVLLRRPLVIIIESSFWRVTDPETANGKDRFRAALTERFARWSVRRAALSVFTSTAYRDELVTSGTGKVLVAPAAWIREEDILSEAAAAKDWAAKSAVPRFLYAGRLNEAKGVRVLLEALETLDAKGIRVAIDIIGEGDLKGACAEAAARFSTVDTQILPPVPYGTEFFALLRRYSGIIVPSLSDEQPRIVFDAYAQAVPVLASDTSGHRDCVKDGTTGRLVPPGDADALAGLLQALSAAPEQLTRLGQGARTFAGTWTHRQMHQTRAVELAALFAPAAE